jgi:hypothetical protein
MNAATENQYVTCSNESCRYGRPSLTLPGTPSSQQCLQPLDQIQVAFISPCGFPYCSCHCWADYCAD